MWNKRKILFISLFFIAVLLVTQSASARYIPPPPSYTTSPSPTPTTVTPTPAPTPATTTIETTPVPTTTPAPAAVSTSPMSDLTAQLTSLLKQLITLLTAQLQSLQQQLAAKLAQQPVVTPPTAAPTTTPITTPAPAVVSAENKPPRINIVFPSIGDERIVPASTDIFASAFDEDGSISQIEFFAGGVSLGIVKQSQGPWSVSWNNMPVGTHSLTARATDDKGASATSAPVELKVKPLSEITGGMADIPPTITIAGFGATASSGQSVSIVATASTYAGSISQVVFYKASSNTAGIISTDVASPFQVSTTMGVTGSWTLSATATNSQGSTKNSGSTTINIGPN